MTQPFQMPLHLLPALRRRAEEGRPIVAAVVGAGQFGVSVAAQLGHTVGLRLGAVVDLVPERARAAADEAGARHEAAVFVRSGDQAADAIRSGRVALADDWRAIVDAPVDVIVESTGRTEAAAALAEAAIAAGKHLVMVSVEADAVVGSLLARRARQAGVAYSLADGDQPAAARRLLDWVKTLGFPIVACGRSTSMGDADFNGTLDDIFDRYGFSPEFVATHRLNPKTYNSFKDGSKAQIEMASLANACGLVPDCRGMHEPLGRIPDLPNLFRPRSAGGVLEQTGVVELINTVRPNGERIEQGMGRLDVFVVAEVDHRRLAEDFALHKLPVSDDQHYVAFYIAHHIPGIETTLTVAEVGLTGRSCLEPLPRPVADVIAIAKRDLRAGERLDGPGGMTLRGAIDRAEVILQEGLLSLGMADGLTLLRDVAAGQPVPLDAVTLDESEPLVRLKREQDALLHSELGLPEVVAGAGAGAHGREGTR